MLNYFIVLKREGVSMSKKKNKWYQLTPDELKEVVDGPKNVGIKGSILTFILVVANIGPVFLRHPIEFTKSYIHVVMTRFIEK